MNRTSIAALSVLLVVLCCLFLLNPGQLQHETTVEKALERRNPISLTIGVGMMTKNLMRYHNFLLFSTTTVGGESLSTGFAGKVWVKSFGPGELQRLLDKASSDAQTGEGPGTRPR